MSGRIVVGTSSWADPGFVAQWYPPGLAQRERLAWYAEHFEAVEVNSTFRRYGDDELQEIGGRAGRLAEDAATVRTMSNNNRGADGPVAAQRLRTLLGQEVAA